ncbi:unnamed protein product [Brassica rapa]|uniref:Uncharacterized protein n=2 Tax=Brassica TaxID=3705 RepID=A0A8D9HLI1_BRACM|nr:unnamed protein product [Brassica napus]CAG7901112.1 unnamed protein product [Brassica rapa]
MSTPMSWPPFLTVLASQNPRRQTSAMFEHHSAFKSVTLRPSSVLSFDSPVLAHDLLLLYRETQWRSQF